MVDIENIEKPGYLEMTVKGEIDASSSIHLDEALAHAVKTYNGILMNLTELEYISSAGLGVFMSYIDEIETRQIKFWLFGLSESVHHIFEILGIDQLLNIAETEDEALKLINETPA